MPSFCPPFIRAVCVSYSSAYRGAISQPRVNRLPFPHLRNSTRCLWIPPSYQVFNDIRLVLTPDQPSDRLPFAFAMLSKDSICRHTTYAHLLCLRRIRAQLCFDLRCISSFDQCRTIITAIGQHVRQNSLI